MCHARARDRIVGIWLDQQNVPGYPDITGWTESELMDYYGLSLEDAKDLYLAVNQDLDRYTTYSLPDEYAGEFLSMVQESIHQGHDGYSDHDRFVIDMFLNDLAIGMDCIIKDKSFKLRLVKPVEE